MLRSALVLAFIGGVGAAGVLVAMKPTVADGRVMSASLLEQVRDKGIEAIECDREIPIGVAGAVFRCSITGGDGSTARIEYRMNREGALTAKVLESTGPTRARPDPTPDSTPDDPWSD